MFGFSRVSTHRNPKILPTQDHDFRNQVGNSLCSNFRTQKMIDSFSPKPKVSSLLLRKKWKTAQKRHFSVVFDIFKFSNTHKTEIISHFVSIMALLVRNSLKLIFDISKWSTFQTSIIIIIIIIIFADSAAKMSKSEDMFSISSNLLLLANAERSHHQKLLSDREHKPLWRSIIITGGVGNQLR